MPVRATSFCQQPGGTASTTLQRSVEATRSHEALLVTCGFEERPITVTDDFPSTASICQAELDAIERFMGDILDEVFGHSATAGEGASRPK
ncbi:MAG: hypothetical protein ABL901_17840 [Hyphomicrobiaceae bacterium]